MDDVDAALEGLPIAPPSLTGARGIRVGRNPNPDPVWQRRTRNNRNRGKGTSKDLAEYLGGQNVESLNWPWDVQGRTWRIQSKRDQANRNARSLYALISAITAGDYLRAVYHVYPAKRLTSGLITCEMREWVAWHGWTVPTGSVLISADGAPLVVMTLPVFKDLHCAGD